MSNLERSNPNRARNAAVIAFSTLLGGVAAAELVKGEGVPCDPNMDVCVPGVTVPPIPPEDTVVGNPQPGETIPVESTFAPKGPEKSSTTTTTTQPEVTTTTSTTTTTQPEVTTTTSTTTTTEVPEETTTTIVPPTVVTTAPPTLPPITVTIPPTPGETN